MKLRNPWLIWLAALIGAWAIRLWMCTVRYRYHLNGQHVHPNDPELQGRYIYAFWHDSMLFPAGRRFKGPLQVLISQSADGELIAQVSLHLGFRVVRGSSSRGGAAALRELLEKSQGSHLVVTPDGPRGPRRRVHQGVAYLASRTGLPLVPVGIGFSRAWRGKGWDRFGLPKLGSIATCVAGPVLHVPPDLEREGLEEYRQRFEELMRKATADAEAWAERGIPPVEDVSINSIKPTAQGGGRDAA